MRSQVQRTILRCFAALHQLRQIHCSVSATTLQTSVVTLVLAWLDYGNSMLIGLPTYLMRRLQLVQRAAAQLIFNLKRCFNITERIRYDEVTVLRNKVLHVSAPLYLGLWFASLTSLVDIPSALLVPIAWWCPLSAFSSASGLSVKHQLLFGTASHNPSSLTCQLALLLLNHALRQIFIVKCFYLNIM
jgi:hypothetical protein